MNSFTLPDFSVNHALNRGGNGSETVASHSPNISQDVDSKDYSSVFNRELRLALDTASDVRGAPAPPVSTAIDGLLSGSDLPLDGNDLPIPAMPDMEIGEPTPTGFGFVWLANPENVIDPGVPNAAITKTGALAALSVMAGPSRTNSDPSVQLGASDAQPGTSGGTTGAAAAPGTAAFAPALGRAATGLPSASMQAVNSGMTSMTGITATGAGISATAAQVSTGSDGPGIEAWATNTAGATEATPASIAPLSTQQLSAVQHTFPAGVAGAALVAGGPDWSSALAQRIGWMLEGQLGRAEIAIDPPELGPLQVRITTLNDQTQVQFQSQHAAVRDALDQALPRLREMLEAQGLQLAHADVSDQQQSDGRRDSASALLGEGVDNEETGSPSALEHSGPVMTVGLIDAYA